MKKLTMILGYIGLVLVQGSVLPTIVSIVMGWSDQLPPFSMILMAWAGLGLFLINSIFAGNLLFFLSNLCGFVLESILLYAYFFPLTLKV